MANVVRDGVGAAVTRIVGLRCKATRALCAIILQLVCVIILRPAHAQVGGSWQQNQVVVASAEEMTRALLALRVQYAHAGPNQQAQLLPQLLDLAATRQQLLASLIADEPQEVLRVALPASLRSSLPSVVQQYIEQEADVEGTLEVLVEDRPSDSIVHYRLKTDAGEQLALHFAADPPTHLVTDSRVRVHGVRVDGALALTSGSGTSVQTLALATPNTFGAQNTLVMLVNFQDKSTQSYTVATAQSVVFGTTSNFDLENSFQQTWLVGDVVGWFTIPVSYTVCDTSSIATYAKQAATAAGVTLSAYNRYVYAFPPNACSWWGLGSVGGNPSQAWINGSFQLGVVAHEMGHNFGLYHSNAWECGSTTLGGSCSSVVYGDTLDMMGGSLTAHFNAFQKERLGWLNYSASPPITTVQADGTYALEPYESQTAGPKALKILKATNPTTGKKTWYYVEYRRALGFDSFLSTNTNVLNGAVVHTGSESSGNSSYLLDMTPATSSWYDPALDVGLSFYDPNVAVTITPVSASSSAAAVNVAFGPLVCIHANPTVVLSPSGTQWAQPGTSVSYTVSVTNNDNGGCTASAFNLQAAVPDGLTATIAPSLSVAPGATASTTLQVTSATSAADGFYTVTVTATNSTDSTFSGSSSVTYVVASSLNVTVVTDKASYTRAQSVAITATVSFGGSAVANASVTITITKANGSLVSLGASTNVNGAATTSLRLKRQDPLGTYQVRAAVSVNTVVGSATTSFVVQ